MYTCISIYTHMYIYIYTYIWLRDESKLAQLVREREIVNP